MSTERMEEDDAYLKGIKASLSAAAVLKAELAALKSASGEAKVFAYEGVTDKVIYSHWIAKAAPELEYEPFVCRNKNQLLRLFRSLCDDLTGLNKNVFFFTDRDFDDLQGHIANESIFMTEVYSVENYLVDADVLTELLKIEMHCHGNPDVRSKVVALFGEKYDEFLLVSASINFRIFLARKCGIPQIGEIVCRLSELARIELFEVNSGGGDIRAMVRLEREPSEEEVVEHTIAFQQLNARARYRGKFALQFFIKWLNLLLADRNADKPQIFSDLPQSELVAKGSFAFEMLAAKSRPPQSFRDFLHRIGQDGVPNLAAA